jgi:hypothetical protein
MTVHSINSDRRGPRAYACFEFQAVQAPHPIAAAGDDIGEVGGAGGRVSSRDRHDMAIPQLLSKHILDVTTKVAIVLVEIGIRMSPIGRTLETAGVRKGQEQEAASAEDAAELAQRRLVIRHVLQHVAADDDVIAAVRSIDVLQVEAVRFVEDADLVRLEPTALDGRVLAELQAAQGAQSPGTEFEKDSVEGAMALERAAALATRSLAGRAQSFLWTAHKLPPAADVAAWPREVFDDPPQQTHGTFP